MGMTTTPSPCHLSFIRLLLESHRASDFVLLALPGVLHPFSILLNGNDAQ